MFSCFIVFMRLTLSSPDADEETTSPDQEAHESHEASATSAEASETETTSSEQATEELPQVEEKVITPLEQDEEEPISSTITLLDKEEELDEHKEEGDYRGRRQGLQDCCSLLPPFSSFCSCAASLEEYLHRRCSASLHRKRKCQALHKRKTIHPIKTPVWHQSAFPTICPEQQQRRPPPSNEVHQPREEEEQAAEPEPESRASSSETLPPPQETAGEPPKEPAALEASQLEPSQTSNMPKPSDADSSSAKLTPVVKTPQLSSQGPEKNQHVPAEEKPSLPPAPTRGSAHIQPTADVGAEAEEEKQRSDGEASETIGPVKTSEAAGHTQVLHPKPPQVAEQNFDAPAVPEDDPVTSEVVAPPASEGLAEPEPSADQALLVSGDPRVDGLLEDVSAPPPPVPVSSSLLDIYADPPNGTEPNGNPVHGSSQKESVFMRLNNRIKALEMNMSLSGRYLEQLSQR